MIATISADIVSSTSLTSEETILLKQKIEYLFQVIESKYPDFWGRQIKGDYLECYIPNVSDALRIALLIKAYIKSVIFAERKQSKAFYTYGLRMAIGIGDMRIVDKEHGILDGEAIYLSGRAMEDMNSLSKGTMLLKINVPQLASSLNTVCVLVDALMNSTTKRQSEVVFYKLLSMKETDIADRMGISQASVNEHSTSARWYCLENALDYFEHINFTEYE